MRPAQELRLRNGGGRGGGTPRAAGSHPHIWEVHAPVRPAVALQRLQGRFILSMNAKPEAIELFSAFRIERVATAYGVTGKGATPASEIIVFGPHQPDGA